jgi:hypothetical protein
MGVVMAETPTTKPKYAGAVERALRAAADNGTLVRGRVTTVEVRHDPWCALLAGWGGCNCDPEVGPPKLVPAPEDN